MGNKQVVEMEKEITKLKQEVKAIASGLSKKVEDKLKPKWSEVVSSHIKNLGRKRIKTLIELRERTLKNSIMESLFKLRNANDSIIIIINIA